MIALIAADRSQALCFGQVPLDAVQLPAFLAQRGFSGLEARDVDAQTGDSAVPRAVFGDQDPPTVLVPLLERGRGGTALGETLGEPSILAADCIGIFLPSEPRTQN